MKVKELGISLAGAILLTIGGLALYDRLSVGADSIPAAESEALAALPMQTERFYSQAMGTNRQYGVILPPDYDQHPDQRYPVIVLLHGGHDDLRAYADQYGIAQVLQQLYATHQLPSAIVVMPDGNDNRGSSYLWDPQYFDGPNGKLGTLIGSELVQQIKDHYRTLPGPQFWAMGGVSSGGWGAVNIGLRHLDSYGILFSHSGYFTDSSGAQNSPESFIKQLPASSLHHLHIYMDAGDNGLDTDMRTSSQTFHQTLEQMGISNVFHIFPGGHGMSGPDIGWNYFHKHLTDSLTYVGQQFEQSQMR
ncbi:alpha/beta hydrolase [Nodosilinea nodulosa]|uniref:alpha/beta hydrolase n=1 Tax=Nodosilinea nodulosa TaxID=416001 RepID=UPI00030FAD76|nr:alpha/beta hydrolase-fold protein [Nodosilinea nodulosa]